MDKNMTQVVDFGFNSPEYDSQKLTIPYCQILNSNKKNSGIAITQENQELSDFQPNKEWRQTSHEFNDGTEVSIAVTTTPRLVILDKSDPFMVSDGYIQPFNKTVFDRNHHKAFSYLIVWFLDENKQPLSQLPFRLKISGKTGYSFLWNYDYYNNPQCFTKLFFKTYKEITNDRAIAKEDLFYSHGIYQPKLAYEKITSSVNGQSSYGSMTTDFIKPNKDNFSSLIIPNKSPVSLNIGKFKEETKDWISATNICSKQ